MTCRIVLIVSMALMSISKTLSAQADDSNSQISVASTDWAWWRGPTRNGVAESDQTPPMAWDDEKNILWKSPVPGRGHSSPTVVGNRIFLATADEAAEIQSVLCYDRVTGKLRWKTDIHQGGFATIARKGHIRSSKASSTVASDGERLFIAFLNKNAIYLTALDLSGKQLWQKKVSDFMIHQGYAASPAIYGSLVIVSADHKGGGTLSGFDRASGELIWTQKRPELPNYTSPIILNIAGRDQLIILGCDLISSYDPLTGKKGWEVEGSTVETVTSAVSDGQVVVTSGGYPSKHISVVRGDGSGELLWRNDNRVYVPSMLIHDGYLYAVNDSGDARCYELETGKIAWEHRLRAKFTASPILVGEHIYAASDNGTTYIFKATPKAFELIGQNTLAADEIQATPAICGSKIYMRVAQGKGPQRHEMLYCIGE